MTQVLTYPVQGQRRPFIDGVWFCRCLEGHNHRPEEQVGCQLCRTWRPPPAAMPKVRIWKIHRGGVLMPIVQEMERINRVINRESYDWLGDQWPDLLDAVEEAVAQEATPEEIYHHIRRQVGDHRLAVALRCRQAAEHIRTQQ